MAEEGGGFEQQMQRIYVKEEETPWEPKTVRRPSLFAVERVSYVKDLSGLNNFAGSITAEGADPKDQVALDALVFNKFIAEFKKDYNLGEDVTAERVKNFLEEKFKDYPHLAEVMKRHYAELERIEAVKQKAIEKIREIQKKATEEIIRPYEPPPEEIDPTQKEFTQTKGPVVDSIQKINEGINELNAK